MGQFQTQRSISILERFRVWKNTISFRVWTPEKSQFLVLQPGFQPGKVLWFKPGKIIPGCSRKMRVTITSISFSSKDGEGMVQINLIKSDHSRSMSAIRLQFVSCVYPFFPIFLPQGPSKLRHARQKMRWETQRGMNRMT